MLPTASVHLHHLHDHIVCIFAATRWSFAFHGPWLLRMDMLFTCDPANVNHVFTTHSAIYPKGPDFADMFELFGESLLNTDGETWHAQRRMLHNLMTDRRFRSYELRASRDKVENGLIPLLRRLAESNAAVDLQDVFLRLTFDTTCTLVLGVDPGCLSDGFSTVPFAKALDDASEAIFFRHVVPKIMWKVLKWLEIGRERKLAAAARVMDAFVDETIAARRKQVEVAKEGEAVEPADLLTTYMLQSVGNRNSVEFVEFDGFLQANAKNLLLAGRDTTAVTLTWFFWLLSKNPDVEEAIVEELKANWPRPASEESTPFDREALGKLVYLHAALCECLRLYPPVAIEHKGVSRADVLPSGHAVRPGTILIFHLYSMGRMEGIWGEDCMEFRPERWIVPGGGSGSGSGREIKHEPAHKFFAFNCGPRSCLGKEMAFNTMKTVVAAMLYNFH
ncbi:Alkane hydroxylase MAH1, partial [Ananas comosus]